MTADTAFEHARAFVTAAPPVTAEPYGGGHVNDTFRVTDETGRDYLLQRIGPAFKQPLDVMDNIALVTGHLAAKSPDERTHLTLVPTRDGALWTGNGVGGVWRMYHFIERSAELPSPVSATDFRQVGAAFGRFLLDVGDLDAGRLHVTIPHYHDEPQYVALLKQAVTADIAGRVGQVGPEIAQALSYEEFSHRFDDPALMPLRVAHNDAKVSNVLVDETTHEPLCVVDLDTMQPGLAAFDFGDSIRSGASTAPEDEPDTSKVAFSMDLFAAYADGYLGACGQALTTPEIDNLRTGAAMATLETSLRFLTDYIAGDVYYRVDHPHHNLERCRNQLTLLADIMAHWDDMGDVIEHLRPRPKQSRPRPSAPCG